ncbi:tetratricopeptide repeat protein, partial [Streptomyces sp. NPDC049577]|uniref:tetratricopeptide repeat protein n=1 Tax=Streptomyces sp. NPDC049577 TaxID=3155153 RepID=UPI003429DCA9
DTSLLESAAPGRYRFHDLVRLYARACAERDEHPPTERTAALSRLLDFYLATAAGVYVLERPGDRLRAHLTPTTHPGLAFTDSLAAGDWLYAEADCLLACARQHAGSTGDALRRAVDLLLAAKDVAESGADSRQYEQVATLLLAATRAAGDTRAEARARTVLAHVHSLAGRFAQADEQARNAVLLGRACQDPISCSNAANNCGIVALYQHRHEDGETYISQALEAFRADGNKPGEASALCNLSRAHLATGRVESAVRLAEQAIVLYRETNPSWRHANALYAYAVALTEAGRHEEAMANLHEALPVFRDNRQRFWEGMTLFRIAELHLATAQPGKAAAHAEQALAVLRGIGGEWRRGNILTVLGRCLDALGQTGRAHACWTEALASFEQLGSPEADEVRTLLTPVVAA